MNNFEQKLLLLVVTILTLIQNLRSNKIVITKSAINQYLLQSKFYIPNDSEYHITFWLRIYQKQITAQTTIIWRIENNNNQFLSLSLDGDQTFQLQDEQNNIKILNWNVPFQSGLQDLQQNSTAYDKWLPILISQNLQNELYVFSFQDYDFAHFTNKQFQNITSSSIDFNPVNDQNIVHILYENLIYRDQLVNSVDQVNNFIYNNGYMGLFTQKAFSNNKKVFYNLNQKNEYSQYHIYFNNIQPLIFENSNYYSVFQSNLPNFFDSHVYYLQQFYQELNVKKFVSQDILDDGNTYSKQFKLYNRYFYVQSIYMSFDFNMSFYYNKNKFTFDYSVSFQNDQQKNILYENKAINKTVILEDYLTFDFVMCIVHIPQSNFIKKNQIRFFVDKKYENKYSQFDFGFDQTIDVNFLYSGNDIIQQKQEILDQSSQIIGFSFQKMIFYRDLNFSIIQDQQSDTSYYFGYKQQVLLFKIQSRIQKHYLNYNVNNMNDILMYEGYEISTQNQQNCFNLVSLCDLCINFTCLKCKIGYYLVDGKCLVCNENYMIFINQCVIEHQKQNKNNYNDVNLYYNDTYLQLIRIQNLTTLNNDIVDTFNMFANDIIQLNNLLDQIKNQFNTGNLKIQLLQTFYVSSFWPQELSLCLPSKFFSVQDSFKVECIDTCASGYILKQEKICIKDDSGCKIYNQNGSCVECQTNYQSIMYQGTNLCVANDLSILNTTYNENFSQIQTLITINNCVFQNAQNQCIICEQGYILNQTNLNCNYDFFINQQGITLASCTQYDYFFLILTCTGQLSNVYQDVDTTKWNNDCKTTSDSIMNDCNICNNISQKINQLQNCYECLNFDATTNQCLECQQGYQLKDGDCYQQTCTFFTENCQNCGLNNFTQCDSCLSGFQMKIINQQIICEIIQQTEVQEEQVEDVIVQEEQNIQVQTCDSSEVFLNIQQFCLIQQNLIQNCQLYDQNQFCIQCNENFFLEKYYVQNQTNLFCVQKQILQCNIYYQNELCQQCKQNYQLSQNLNECVEENQCDNQLCIYENQHQVLYQKVIDQCLIQIQFCQLCNSSDKSQCIQCNENFYLDNNSCLMQTLQISEINFLEEFCQFIIKGCQKCQYKENQYICIKCNKNYQLQDKKCIYQNIENLEICFYPCIQCKNAKCIDCVNNYSLKRDYCSSEILQDFIECVDYIECYVNGKPVNDHCKKCKNQCNFNIQQNTIYFDQNIQLETNSQKSSTLNYNLITNIQENSILVIQKETINQNDIIQIRRDLLIIKSYNCVPKLFYQFEFKKINTQIAQQIQDKTFYFENYIPSILSTLNLDRLKFLFQITINIKIFQYLPYLNIKKGSFYDKIYTLQRQSLDKINVSVTHKFFQNANNIKMYIEILKIDLVSINYFSSLKQEILLLIAILAIQNLLFLARFSRKGYKKFKKSVKRQLKQYLILKVVILQLTFLTYANSINYFIETNKLLATFLILSILISSYGTFWAINKMIRNNKKFHKIFYKKKFYIKKDFIKQKFLHRNYFHVIQSFFLFLKLKIAYDFNNYNNLGLSLFIIVNIVELFKYKLIKKFKYLKIIYIFEVLSNLSLIIFTSAQIFRNLFLVNLNENFLNTIFIFSFSMQILTPILENIISYKRNKLQTFEQIIIFNCIL